MFVAPDWKIWEGRIVSEIGEYYLETTDIDVGTPKRSAQQTQGVLTCPKPPEWKIWEGRIFSEIGEYSAETTNIDVGTPKRSAQPTQEVPRYA